MGRGEGSQERGGRWEKGKSEGEGKARAEVRVGRGGREGGRERERERISARLLIVSTSASFLLHPHTHYMQLHTPAHC